LENDKGKEREVKKKRKRNEETNKKVKTCKMEGEKSKVDTQINIERGDSERGMENWKDCL
jgi:hypothetical protein